MMFQNSLRCINDPTNKLKCITTVLFRYGHTIRGKRPGIARNLAQRLEEENYIDPDITRKVDIGFPQLKPSRTDVLRGRLEHVKQQRKNPELEKKARTKTLLIDLNEVQKDYKNSVGQFHLKTVANHYGIFKDIFGDAYFIPRVPLEIKYQAPEECASIVYNGNILKPSEVRQEPEVIFDGTHDIITRQKSAEDIYFTLIMTNLDSHLLEVESECLHWFVSNIPKGEVSKGEIIAEYIQPFPPKGIGYQRFAFVLYKQEGKLNFNDYKISERNNVEKRYFSSLEFYKKYQDKLTPAGLSFFLSSWDESVTEFYHKTLGIKQPMYEYDFPRPYITEQKWFPLRQPFNLYLDKHRDQKQVHKEYLVRKLSKTHPFKGPEPPLKFPNAHPLRDMPSWLKTEIKKDRLKMGRINDI